MKEQIRDRLLSELTGGEETIGQTPVSFSVQVEHLAQAEHLTLLESLSVLVETHDLDPDQIPKMITEGLKQKLALENGIEKSSKALNI